MSSKEEVKEKVIDKLVECYQLLSKIYPENKDL
jgi:hypothetical protein